MRNKYMVNSKKTGHHIAKQADNSTGAVVAIEEENQEQGKAQDKKIILKQYPVTGMSCASCAANVESRLSNQPGVVKAAVNLASEMATSRIHTFFGSASEP